MSKEGTVATVGGNWSAENSSSFVTSGLGASEPLKISENVTLKYLLSANWILDGETLDT